MRKKKLIATVAILLLVVFMLSLALVACKPTEKPTDNPPDIGNPPSGGDPSPVIPPPPPNKENDLPIQATSFKEAMGYFVESMSGAYMSLDFTGYATVGGTKYVMSLKGNVSDDLELAMVFKTEQTDETAFAMYVINSRLFLQVADKDDNSAEVATIDDAEGDPEGGEGAEVVVKEKTYTIYNIAEIDVDYLLSIVDKLPDKISELINGVSIPGLNLSIPEIVDIVLGLLLSNLSPSDTIVYENVDGVEKFELTLDINNMLSPIIGLLAPNSIIGGVLPKGLDLSFVSDLLNMVPKINGDIKATVNHGVLSEFNLELRNNDPKSENYKQVLLGLDNVITFGQEKIDLGISDELKEQLENYQTLTLGNLNFDFALELNTGDEPFDIGAFIDAVLTSSTFNKGAMFGEGLLVLDAHAQYRLEVKASLDPDIFGNKEDRNYINVMLYVGEREILRANYLEGKLYLRVLGDGVNGFAEGGVNVAINLNLKKYISQLVELLTGYIDGFLGTQFRPETAASAILSSSVTRSGDVILSPSIQDIIVSILKLLGMEKCIDMTGGDHITILINEDLFAAIGKLANVDIDLPIFGDLTVGLFKGGIEFVEINALDIVTLRADNFLIGKAKITKDDVLESIGYPEDYNTDIKDVILSFALNLLSDLDVSIALDVSTVDTTVNLTSIINSIMAVANTSTYIKFPITLDLSQYDGTFNVRLATNYNVNTGDGRVLIEVFTPDNEVLIAAYNENADTYVDLSGLGFMKFRLSNVNIFQMLRGMLGAIEFDEELFDDEGETADTFLSSSATIDNDFIGLAVESVFVTKILRMLSMDLGFDAALNAHLAFDGSVNAELDLGLAATLGLRISLGKESESQDKRGQHRIETAIEELAKREFGEYNASSAEMLVDSILNAENLYFTIDLYNQNVDYTSHENKTRIVIRRSTAGAPGLTETLGNGLGAPYRSLVIEVYSGWNCITNNALIYAYLDFDNRKVQFKGTKAMLNVNLVVYQLTGEVLDIGIDNVDLRSMLVNALSGIFEKSGVSGGNSGNVIEVPDGALPPQKPIAHECKHKCDTCGDCLDPNCKDIACIGNRCLDGSHHNCRHKCSVCGKCTDANCQDDVCVNKIGKCAVNGAHHVCKHICEVCGKCTDAACKDSACSAKCEADENGIHPKKESTPIEQILPGIKVTLTGNMDIDVDVDINGKFITKFLKEMLQDLFTELDVSAMTGTAPITLNYDTENKDVFFNDLYAQLLIPLIKKQVGDATTSGIGSIVGSIADNADIKKQVHNLVQRFLPLPNVDTLGVNVSLTNGKLANISAVASNTGTYTDAETGYGYRSDFGFGIYIFNAKANNEVSWEHQATSVYFNRTFGGNLADQFEQNVRVHTYTDNDKSNWETDSWYSIDWKLADNSMTLDEFISRLNIKQGQQNYIADGEYVFAGKAFVAILNRTVEQRVTLTLDSSEIQSIKDMDVPAMREVPTYVIAVLGKDGDGNDIEKLITDVDIQLAGGRVNAEKNASVVIGGKTHQFTINFEAEELTLDTLDLNAYDYIDRLNELEEAGVIRVKVNDTFYRNLPAEFNWTDVTDRSLNVKRLSRETAQVRQTYFVNVHVGRGTEYECDLTMPIEFKPFDIYYIERDVEGVFKPDYSKGERNELNYIETDFIEAAYGMSFPEEMTVVGYDGKEWLRYTARFDWNTDAVTVDLKGGQFFASAVINKGDYNQWVMEGIEVSVLPSDIVALASSSKTTVFDLKYYLYGGVKIEDCLTSVLNFRTSEGVVKRDVPVTIDATYINIDEAIARAKSGLETRVTCPVSVDVKRIGSAKSLFTTTVTVIIPSLKMSLMDNDFMTDGEITVDVSDENFTGLSDYFNMRSKMEIKLGDDVVTANVEWNTDDVIVGVDGSYTARVYIGRRGSYEQYCSVKVNITGNSVANEEV